MRFSHTLAYVPVGRAVNVNAVKAEVFFDERDDKVGVESMLCTISLNCTQVHAERELERNWKLWVSIPTEDVCFHWSEITFSSEHRVSVTSCSRDELFPSLD